MKQTEHHDDAGALLRPTQAMINAAKAAIAKATL